MALVKYLLELVLTTIIIFFVWNFMKRIFYTSFYKIQKPQPKNQENPASSKQKNQHGLNWDAEEAEYEEVQEKRN